MTSPASPFPRRLTGVRALSSDPASAGMGPPAAS